MLTGISKIVRKCDIFSVSIPLIIFFVGSRRECIDPMILFLKVKNIGNKNGGYFHFDNNVSLLTPY